MSDAVFDIDDIVTIKESPTYLHNGGTVLGLTKDKRTAFIRFDTAVPTHLIQHAEGLTGLRCAFCGKRSDEVIKMIAGKKAYICGECVGICQEIIAESVAKETVPKPETAKKKAAKKPRKPRK